MNVSRIKEEPSDNVKAALEKEWENTCIHHTDQERIGKRLRRPVCVDSEISSLRSRLAIQTEALKQIERPVADMIRIRDDKTIVWDFHKECDANLEPLAEALQAVRNALAQSETPAPQENPQSQLVEERLEEIARRLQDKLTGCTEHGSWFVKSNSHKMILSALREVSSLPEQQLSSLREELDRYKKLCAVQHKFGCEADSGGKNSLPLATLYEGRPSRRRT